MYIHSKWKGARSWPPKLPRSWPWGLPARSWPVGLGPDPWVVFGGWWRSWNLHTCEMLRNWWCGVGGGWWCSLNLPSWPPTHDHRKMIAPKPTGLSPSPTPKPQVAMSQPPKPKVPPLNPNFPCPSPQNLKGCPFRVGFESVLWVGFESICGVCPFEMLNVWY